MHRFPSGTVVRVLQEDWAPFQNIRRTVGDFTARTGVKVEVTLSTIPEFWRLMEQSFMTDQPAFDLIGADEIMLLQYAREGRVEPLEARVAGEGYPLDDFEPARAQRREPWRAPVRPALRGGGRRADLSPRPVRAARGGGPADHAGTDRGGGGHSGGRAGRGHGGLPRHHPAGAAELRPELLAGGVHLGPAWGATWYDEAGWPTLDTPELLAAVEHYIDLLRRAGPPESWKWGFAECMACYSAGKAAMVIEPANEAAVVYDRGGVVADGTFDLRVPAGPRGTRHAGLYCPPYAIPAASPVKEAAWELAKFLCDAKQVLDDALRSGFVEVARRRCWTTRASPAASAPTWCRPARATRAIARAERPTPRQGMLVGDIIGEELAAALAGGQSPRAALQRAQQRVAALGPPE